MREAKGPSDGEGYVTATGSIQGCPYGMAVFCVGSKRPRRWVRSALEAASAGELSLTPGMSGLGECPVNALRQMSGVLHAELGAREPAARLAREGGESEVAFRCAQKFYADNGTWLVPPALVPVIPQLAAICFGQAGLSYKPGHWEAWSPAGQEPPRARAAGAPVVRVRSAEEGMIVVGGGLSTCEVSGVLGPQAAAAAYLEGLVERVESIVGLLGHVPAAAAPSHAAPRHVLQALVRSVRLKATHAARMFPPAQSRPFLTRIDATVKRGVTQAFEWSEKEADEAWPLCELAQAHGGLGLRPLQSQAPFLHLSAWLSATSTGRLDAPRDSDPAEWWGKAQCERGRYLRSLYQSCRAQNRELPRELGLHAELEMGSRCGWLGAEFAQWSTKWVRLLSTGVEDERLRAWRARASPERRAHREALGHGRWLLQEPPGPVRYSRVEWLIAVRLWHDLEVWPAIPDSDECARVCQNWYVVQRPDGSCVPGDLCKSRPGGRRRGNEAEKAPTPLDAKGRHALVCKVGGCAVKRHDFIRDVLGGALRPLVSGVQWERYIPDIVRADGAEKSRLDLVVRDAENPAMLDVVVFYPLQPSGRALYRHADHERAKFDRYRPTRDGRRQHALPLVPVVVSVFGVLNEICSIYLNEIEWTAKRRGKPFVPRVGGPRSLEQLVSWMGILEAASIVADSHSQRLGREAAA